MGTSEIRGQEDQDGRGAGDRPGGLPRRGPVWYPGWGGLRFVDMLAGDILSLAPTAPSNAATSAT